MIDFEKMNEAAAALFDYTDFTSFSKVNTDTKTNNCRIMQARWTELAPGEWRFEIQADRFLRNMVRAIVGTLVEVGRGKLTPEGFRAVIEGKDRCRAGESMPGNALFLVDVAYPDKCFMVENRNGKEKRYMWLILAFTSAALLGFYDVFKKKSLRDNAVIPVLFLNTLFCSLIFLPFILGSAWGMTDTDNLFYIPPTDWERRSTSC